MSSLSILVVEDDDAVCRMVAVALRGYGFAVQLASSGMQAVDIYRREAIDVVLMDVQMPDMDGPETLAALKVIDANVVCCFMSGHPGRHASEDLLRLGAAGIIQKPFPLDELRRFLVRAASEGGQRAKQESAERDRRAFPRLVAMPEMTIACFVGCSNSGPNRALELLDFSQSGLRLRLNGPIDVGQDVFVTIDGPAPIRPMVCAGKVVWMEKSDENICSAGVLLDRCLAYLDLGRVG